MSPNGTLFAPQKEIFEGFSGLAVLFLEVLSYLEGLFQFISKERNSGCNIIKDLVKYSDVGYLVSNKV